MKTTPSTTLHGPPPPSTDPLPCPTTFHATPQNYWGIKRPPDSTRFAVLCCLFCALLCFAALALQALLWLWFSWLQNLLLDLTLDQNTLNSWPKGGSKICFWSSLWTPTPLHIWPQGSSKIYFLSSPWAPNTRDNWPQNGLQNTFRAPEHQS